jgi:hypothetical protein
LNNADTRPGPVNDASGIPPGGVRDTVKPILTGSDFSNIMPLTRACQYETDRQAIERGENEGMIVHAGSISRLQDNKDRNATTAR